MAILSPDATKVNAPAGGMASLAGNPQGSSSGGIVDRLRNFGTTVTAGQVVYLDPSTNTWLLASANSSTAAARFAYGVALNGGNSGQLASVFRGGGPIFLGVATALNTLYFLGTTAGSIIPESDLAAGDMVSLVGIATDTAGTLICPLLPFASPVPK